MDFHPETMEYWEISPGALVLSELLLRPLNWIFTLYLNIDILKYVLYQLLLESKYFPDT